MESNINQNGYFRQFDLEEFIVKIKRGSGNTNWLFLENKATSEKINVNLTNRDIKIENKFITVYDRPGESKTDEINLPSDCSVFPSVAIKNKVNKLINAFNEMERFMKGDRMETNCDKIDYFIDEGEGIKEADEEKFHHFVKENEATKEKILFLGQEQLKSKTGICEIIINRKNNTHETITMEKNTFDAMLDALGICEPIGDLKLKDINQKCEFCKAYDVCLIIGNDENIG